MCVPTVLAYACRVVHHTLTPGICILHRLSAIVQLQLLRRLYIRRFRRRCVCSHLQEVHSSLTFGRDRSCECATYAGSGL